MLRFKNARDAWVGACRIETDPGSCCVRTHSWVMAHMPSHKNGLSPPASNRSNLIKTPSEACRCYPGHSGVTIFRYANLLMLLACAIARERLGIRIRSKS